MMKFKEWFNSEDVLKECGCDVCVERNAKNTWQIAQAEAVKKCIEIIKKHMPKQTGIGGQIVNDADVLDNIRERIIEQIRKEFLKEE